MLILGVVAYFRMTPDLLPNLDFPYVMIMTTYPGASSEKVEAEITKPMEQAMSTLHMMPASRNLVLQLKQWKDMQKSWRLER